MSKLIEILQQTEGRKLEFKEALPANSELSKTVIAFANDAGGELYIGIKDNPRQVEGIKESELITLEGKISNIIHDLCEPVILPEISFLTYEARHIIKILIYKGSNPPYHIKSKPVTESTYIRVGSSNRQATSAIIAELERQKLNKSFDSEHSYLKTFEELSINSFSRLFKEKTGETLTPQTIKKLELYNEELGKHLPTNALILLSDDEIRRQLFPYSKIECARFKGIIPGNFIDQKTIDVNVAEQPEQAYQFVLRHISQGST